MDGDHRIVLARRARIDIEAIAIDLHERAGDRVASRIVHEIEEAIVDLDRMPLRFAVVKGVLRKRTVSSYSIYYRVADRIVTIVRVLHQSRDHPRLL